MDNELNTEQMQELWDEEVNARAASDDSLPGMDSPAPTDQDPTPLVEPEPAPAPVADDDPFASLPDAVKAKLAEIDAIKDANAQLLHHVRSAEGRVAAMQREFEQARVAQQQVAPSEAPSQQAIARAAANPEKWEQLKSDFPEWAEAMEGYVGAQLASLQVPQGLRPEEVAIFVRQQVDASKAEMGRLLEEAKIEGKYEDWRDIVNTSDFASWYAVQKPEIKALAESNNARDAIKMLDMFNDAKARPAEAIRQERGARLAAAAAPTRGASAPPPKSLDSMTPAELWEYEATKRQRELSERGF